MKLLLVTHPEDLEDIGIIEDLEGGVDTWDISRWYQPNIVVEQKP